MNVDSKILRGSGIFSKPVNGRGGMRGNYGGMDSGGTESGGLEQLGRTVWRRRLMLAFEAKVLEKCVKALEAGTQHP